MCVGEAKGSGTADGPPLKQVRSSFAPEEAGPVWAGTRGWVARGRQEKEAVSLCFLKFPLGQASVS